MLNHIFLLMLFSLASACSAKPVQNDESHTSKPTQSACMDGQTKSGFISPTTSGDIPCPRGIQTCVEGKWTGSVFYETCDNSTKSCDGSPHGSTRTGYLQPTTTHGVPCPTSVTTCLNGSWVGPMLYDSCQDLP